MGCPGGLMGTRSKSNQGVGLSVFTRYERRGGTGTRLDNGAGPVGVLVLYTVDEDVKWLALFVGQEPAKILKERGD